MIDISGITSMVRRMDTSATLKNFVAVTAILTAAAALVFSFHNTLFMLADPFDMVEPNDALFVLAIILTGIAASVFPLLFILWDWVARQPWRTLAAINAALLGFLGFGLFGAALGASIDFLLDELYELKFAERLLYAIFFGVLTVLLAAWLVAESQRARRTVRLVVALILVAAIATPAIMFYRDGAFQGSGEAASTILQVVLVVANVVLLIYLLSRAVRNRIVMSGRTPRGLLLGDFHRKGFWVRLAFLTGLPSSLWHARAMKTAAFWAFLLARPIVYGGVAFALSERWQSIGTDVQIAVGAAIIIAGHVLFYGAKRLATAYSWNPDQALDSSPPVLFLRSFEDDQLKFRRAWWNLPRRWLDLWSFRRNADETLIDEIAQYGPVVALGMPGEKKVPFGAQRYYSSHEDWQEIVEETAKQSRAVVLAAGDTPGVRWEYEMLARERLLEKTLLLFPPQTDAAGDDSRKALSAFQELTGVAVEGDPGDDDQIIALVPADGRHELLVSDSTDAAAYVAAIRSFFQNRTAEDLSDPLCDIAA